MPRKYSKPTKIQQIVEKTLSTSSVSQMFERAAEASRFNLRNLVRDVKAELQSEKKAVQILSRVNEVLSEQAFNHVILALVRWTFLIELVKLPAVDTTKYAVRWTDRLARDDPRYTSFEDCVRMFAKLFAELCESLDCALRVELLQAFSKSCLVGYDLPLGYKERLTDRSIHTVDNLRWLWDDKDVLSAIRLRKAVTDRGIVGDNASIFRDALRSKIRVKTYLTDRALTGEYKTNREKRWEAHPCSVQFATQAQCLSVERELLIQLCHFKDFPKSIRKKLIKQGLIEEREETRCPVTLKPLSYREFVKELRSPTHGRAEFQVGHLRPLKLNPSHSETGHTAKNISWISSEGNRIQGSNSIEDTRRLLREIALRYEEHGWDLG